RHRRPAVSRSDPAIHSRSRPAKRREHSRHARAIHQGGGRIKDETDAAKRREVAPNRIATAGADLPDGKTARPRSAGETFYDLQRMCDSGINLKLVDAETRQEGVDGKLKDVAGVLIPGGFGQRGVEGKIKAARFAREQKVPYLGLCLGMQVATIEFARNVCGLEGANST